LPWAIESRNNCCTLPTAMPPPVTGLARKLTSALPLARLIRCWLSFLVVWSIQSGMKKPPEPESRGLWGLPPCGRGS
jgi:hypothetical protein